MRAAKSLIMCFLLHIIELQIPTKCALRDGQSEAKKCHWNSFVMREFNRVTYVCAHTTYTSTHIHSILQIGGQPQESPKVKGRLMTKSASHKTITLSCCSLRERG